MHPLNLVIPGLCGPLPDKNSLHAKSLTSLARLLARADKIQCAQKGFHAEVAALFGLSSMSSVPSAVLSLLGEGRSLGEGHWFHADPVHLQTDMDHAILRDSSSLDLKKEESDALIDEINNHFFEDGIRLIATDTNHWYLNIADHIRIETSALCDVIGCNVNFHLPHGEDEKFWKRFLNEAQMLLHTSDINQKREASGLLPINSLWLWGGGGLPAAGNASIERVCTNHAFVKGLASLNNMELKPITEIKLLLDAIRDKAAPVVVLDDIFTPANYGDLNVWQKTLDVLFEQWIEPLVSHSMRGKLPIQLYPCNGVSYLISPSNKYRLFRKQDIADHISDYESQ